MIDSKLYCTPIYTSNVQLVIKAVSSFYEYNELDGTFTSTLRVVLLPPIYFN